MNEKQLKEQVRTGLLLLAELKGIKHISCFMIDGCFSITFYDEEEVKCYESDFLRKGESYE